MKNQIIPIRSLSLILIIFIALSCKMEEVEYPGNPIKYYLSNNQTLSLNTYQTDTPWDYNYVQIDPSGSIEWSVTLNHNITGDKYGSDLIFFSSNPTKARIEYILSLNNQETILVSKDLDINCPNDSTTIDFKNIISDNTLVGINPLSGRGGNLILRISHIGGEDDYIEIFLGAGTEFWGCTSITVKGDTYE